MMKHIMGPGKLIVYAKACSISSFAKGEIANDRVPRREAEIGVSW